MKRELPLWAPPLLAVQFLTRVPMPALSRLSQDAARVGLGRAVAWFPLVGTLIGAVTAGTMLLSDLAWPLIVAVVVALIVEARLTGAFHEDAVADFCDGAGGGRDPAHARHIMRDSRIGTFGALGLVLALALRAALMYSLGSSSEGGAGSWAVACAIVASATFGRLLVVLVMAITPAVADAESLGRDVTSALRTRDAALAAGTSLPGLLPFAILAPVALLWACLAAALFTLWLRAFVIRRVGGTTGDCLGFTAYAGQLLLLMAAAA